MRSLSYGYFFIFLLSCNNRSSTGKGENKDTTGKIIKDTLLKTSVDTTKNADSTEAVVFKELTKVEIRDYHISVVKDPEEMKIYLIAHNKSTRRTDTAEIDGPQFEGAELTILDVTDSLQVKPLLLEIITPNGSDWYNHEFVGYDSNKLKKLFDIADFAREDRLDLHRKDKWTLSGIVRDRDDLVQAFEKYPVEVSLKDYKVTSPVMPAIYVGWESKVLESFKANRVINNQITDSLYTLKKGVRVIVDSLYVPRNKVRLRVKGSIILETDIDNVKDKISGNAAG